MAPISSTLLVGREDDAFRDESLHDAYRWVLWVVAWTVFIRAEFAAYVQALQRRAHALRITDCN